MWGYMILNKGIFVSTLFYLDACHFQWNSSSILAMKRSKKYTHSQSKPTSKRSVVSTPNGHTKFGYPKDLSL
jgi:hypothetical protein